MTSFRSYYLSCVHTDYFLLSIAIDALNSGVSGFYDAFVINRQDGVDGGIGNSTLNSLTFNGAYHYIAIFKQKANAQYHGN